MAANPNDLHANKCPDCGANADISFNPKTCEGCRCIVMRIINDIVNVGKVFLKCITYRLGCNIFVNNKQVAVFREPVDGEIRADRIKFPDDMICYCGCRNVPPWLEVDMSVWHRVLHLTFTVDQRSYVIDRIWNICGKCHACGVQNMILSKYGICHECCGYICGSCSEYDFCDEHCADTDDDSV